MNMSNYQIIADRATAFDTFWSRGTDINAETFTARAVEFGDPGESSTKRISLRVHPRLDDDGDLGVSTGVVNGGIYLELGDVDVWLAPGTEDKVIQALQVAVAERDRQARLEINVTTTGITGTWVLDPNVAALDEVMA